MAIELNIASPRCGLIADLVRRLNKVSPQVGKTVLVKMIFLLQQIFKIDCGYEFELHTYGPFASQILHDLDLVESLGGVKIHPAVSAGGYKNLSRGQEPWDCAKKLKLFLSKPKVKKGISKVVSEFGSYSARDLELASTIVYVENYMKRRHRSHSGDEVSQIVHGLKPKFTKKEILSQIRGLSSKGYINLTA